MPFASRLQPQTLRRRWSHVTQAATLCLGLLAATAQAAPADAVPAATTPYPCSPVRLLSPYPPGGTTDILARLLAPGLSKGLGTTVVVDNRSGASSNIGTEHVARSAPDGCTLLLGNNTGIVINQNLYELRIDPVKDLTPVGRIASVPLVLYVNQSLPAQSLPELVTLVQGEPGRYSYASGGSGSPQHLAGELLKLERDLDLLHVPYRGQGPALNDVLAGQVPIAFETVTALTPQLASGRVRALATTGEQRALTLPELPTMTELGFDDFVIENWYGVFAPAGTPPERIAQLNTVLNQVLAEPGVAQKFEELGSRNVATTVDEFAAFIQQELPLWQSIVQRSGARLD